VNASITALSERAADAIGLLAEIALHPRFEPSEFNRDRWASVRDSQDDVPATVALRVLPRAQPDLRRHFASSSAHSDRRV